MEFIIENLGKIGFEWKMALFNLINFLILFAILKKFFFAPIVKVIDERQLKANEGVENFQKAKTELQMAQQKAQTLIDSGKVEANKIIEKASLTAKDVAEQLKTQAKGDIDLLVAQAKKNIDIDKKEMKEALRKDMVEVVVNVAEKVLSEKIDAKKDEKFIAGIIDSMDS